MEITAQHLSDHVQRVIKGQFPQTPEGIMFFNVIARALDDAISEPTKTLHPRDIRTAITYLLGRMEHAWLAGVDGQWIRDIMKNCGLLKILQDKNRFELMY